MTRRSHTFRTVAAAAVLLLTTTFTGLAVAVTPAPGGCNANEARNDPAACKRESGASAAEAKKGNLTAPGAAAAQSNTADRCRALSGGEKTDCLSRVGSGGTNSTTTTSGSVDGGGQIRETTTTTTTVVPAKP